MSEANAKKEPTGEHNGSMSMESNGSMDQSTTGNGQNAAPKTELEITQEKLKEAENKYLYLYAEFENYKKRVIKERSELIKFGWENVARELLAVLDNMERALEFMPKDIDSNLRTGIEMVANQFKAAIEKQGVLPITTLNAPFNPDLHEALSSEPSSAPQGTITNVLTKGYTLHGRLLRPARVVVSSGVAQAPA